MKVVTGCDAAYFPGVKALRNSIARNVPGGEIDLWCLVHGDKELQKKIEDLGIKTILNPSFPKGTLLPAGGKWTPKAMLPMYSRLLVPMLFDENVLWLDADTVVTCSIAELETTSFGGCPVAMKRQEDGQWNTGVMLFNNRVWNEQQITERCVKLMNQPPSKIPYVVQSIVNRVVKDAKPLLETYNVNANRPRIFRQPNPTLGKILHFIGMLPWNEEEAANSGVQIPNYQLWKEYE